MSEKAAWAGNLLTLRDWDGPALAAFFDLVDQYEAGAGPRFDAAAAMFFPASSLRTRYSFERGASLMGIQPIGFPPAALDKSEDLMDVAGYLGQWADLAVVRHSDIEVLERLVAADALPVINAMTAVNHPCEVLSDLYVLSRDADLTQLRFLFVGADGNIGRGGGRLLRPLGSMSDKPVRNICVTRACRGRKTSRMRCVAPAL